MLASDILSRARPILHDTQGVRWTDAELLNYIYDAQNQIIEVKPTASSVTQNITLVVGRNEQSIPGNAQKMLRLVRNMGTNNSPGRAIVLTSRAVLDSMNVDWHLEQDIEVQQWIYDPEADRGTFWVYPQVSQAIQVEAVFSLLPDPVTAANDELTLSDRYMNPVLDWVLFRAFSKDSDYASPSGRAMQHLQAFSTAIGVKLQQMMRTNPNNTRRGGETMGQV